MIRINSDNKDFQKLVRLLDEGLSVRDGAEHSFYAQFNKIDEIRHAVVIHSDKKPIGCGAFKKFDDKTAEIKRMFVRTENRGKGIAVEILKELEKWSNQEGFDFAILETGKKQPEAIRLYQKAVICRSRITGNTRGLTRAFVRKNRLF